MRRLAFVLATLVALAATAPATAGAAGPPGAVTYRPPVDAPIIDPFRPPAENWNSGNRGLEYATTPGTLVAASAAGEVVFAGPVADGLHVVVLHDDGLRTSYSFLALIAVHRGEKVTQGQTLGTTQDRFHFGVRAGDAYLDPALLFGGGPPQVYLVPDELRRPQTEAQEREGVARMFPGLAARAFKAGAAAVGWAKDAAFSTAAGYIADKVDEARGAIHYLEALQPMAHFERFAAAAKAWRDARATCTPEDVPQPKLQERHILVRVGGLGSSGGKEGKEGKDGAAVDAVDAAALGYAPNDDMRFSYLGGTTKENKYNATDTTEDLKVSARRLRDLLARVQAENPGVPIDIVAHSQGGLVARMAISDEGEPTDPRLAQVSSLVTLGTPHRGTPAATAATMLNHTDIGGMLLLAGHVAMPNQIDPTGTSVEQMAEYSDVIERLKRTPPPAGVKFTSIAAREDLMVPAGQTVVDGANNVTVSVPGHFNDHLDLPGSPEAQREIALALAGLTPTCQSFGDAMADAAVSGAIYTQETLLGAGAYGGARYLQRRLDSPELKTTVPRRYDLEPPR